MMVMAFQKKQPDAKNAHEQFLWRPQPGTPTCVAVAQTMSRGPTINVFPYVVSAGFNQTVQSRGLDEDWGQS